MASIEEMQREIDSLRARVEAMESASGLFVPDRDLDSPKGGNPQVKFSPKRWRGPDYKGRLYSDCEPAFLDELAETLSWMAANPQPGKEKYADYNRKDAARARSWARRIRGGWRPPSFDEGAQSAGPSALGPTWEPPPNEPFTPPASAPIDDDFGDEIPF